MDPDTVRAARKSPLVRALERLRRAVAAPAFTLSAPERDELCADRDRLTQDIAGHVARVQDLDAPLVVVLGGVTGAGKSTMLNTLLGEAVAATGVIRPTTSVPTLVANSLDMAWFDGDRVLPGLARVDGGAQVAEPRAAGAGLLRLVSHTAVPVGLAIIDAPDVDSVSDVNRGLAEVLLDAADLWLWFTTAGKYADEESMRYLRRAERRRTALAVVLTRVQPEDIDEVVADLHAKLTAQGVQPERVLVVPHTQVQGERLPEQVAADVRAWLWSLAEADNRRAHRRQTLEGALDALPAEVGDLIAALEEELGTARSLSDVASRAFQTARREFDHALEEGLPLRREILSRWNEFVGTGRLLKLAEQASGQARRWVGGLLASVGGGEQERVQREVRIEVADTLSRLVVQLADLAAAETAQDWSRRAAGRALLAAHPELDRSAADLPERAERMARAWQQTVLQLVETKGAERKSRARWMSTVVNAVATGAIVVALAHTGGFTGAEAGIATAAGAANQTLLVKLLGVQNVRWLVSRAREDLTERFAGIATEERRRFTAAVAEAAPDPDAVEELRAAMDAVAAARATDGA